MPDNHTAEAGTIDGRLAFSPKEAAALLGYGLSKVYDLLNDGELDSYLDGRARRITAPSILAYQRRMPRSTPRECASPKPRRAA